MQERLLSVSADCLDSFLHRIEACVGRLSEAQVWWRPNPAVSSVGNLLLHLRGNLSQWVLAGLGGVDYERHRTQEFTAAGTMGKSELLDGLRLVVTDSRAVILGLSAEAMVQRRQIQGYEVDGVYVVLHVTEHMSYHTGQIVHVHIAKELLGPAAKIDFFPQHHGE